MVIKGVGSSLLPRFSLGGFQPTSPRAGGEKGDLDVVARIAYAISAQIMNQLINQELEVGG